MSEAKNVLHVENATMQFGGVVAVDNLNLDVNEGEIVALIGPNGAGKTTTLKSILGLVRPDAGEIRCFGLPFAENEQFGFLSACPANAGTGMRISAMLHLPALAMTKKIGERGMSI